jgi:enediyne biosynthesis protein E4
MGSLFFDADQDGDNDLYVVSGGGELPENASRYQDRLYLNDGKGNFSKGLLPKTRSSGSCVAAYDVDGDGDLDLFRGGQVVAGAYPKSPKNYLLINDQGRFTDNTDAIAPGLSEVGMVNSAVWVDLNGDKKSELVIAGEWMPIKVYQYKEGRLVNVSDEYGLQNTEGWWNKIVADDLDGDGDMDLMAGNLGENYKFKTSLDKPFQVFAKDFDNNGTNDIFLARYYQENLLVPIRGKECTSQQMPSIAQKFPTYLSFAQSDINGILGKDIENAMNYKAYLFSSVMLINENGKLKIKRLPTEAQLSTINGIIVKDFDNDGQKDILMAGNKFDVEVETTAADASPGVFLKGLGNLEFKSLKHFESGFSVPYNVKDIQLITVKGKPVILVSVNNERLRVFNQN